MPGHRAIEGKGKNVRTKPKSRSKRAQINISVGRVLRYLKDGRYAPRISVLAAVHLAGVLEYLCAELLELAVRAAVDHKKKTIKPRHILLAIKHDVEFDQLLKHATISQAGIIPRTTIDAAAAAANEMNSNTGSQEY